MQLMLTNKTLAKSMKVTRFKVENMQDCQFLYYQCTNYHKNTQEQICWNRYYKIIVNDHGFSVCVCVCVCVCVWVCVYTHILLLLLSSSSSSSCIEWLHLHKFTNIFFMLECHKTLIRMLGPYVYLKTF